ncbi:MAG: hypothetical protein M1812_004259 [Candelaria pacifica]|nr:MAG: hypothetical protein M1812_004259 [Candelaria pacifica]
MFGSRPLPNRLPKSPTTRPPRPPCPTHGPFRNRDPVYYDEHIRQWCIDPERYHLSDSHRDQDDLEGMSQATFLAREERAREFWQKRPEVRRLLRLIGETDEDGINPYDHASQASRRRYGRVGVRMTIEQARAHRQWRLDAEGALRRLWKEQSEVLEAMRGCTRLPERPRDGARGRGRSFWGGWGYGPRGGMGFRSADGRPQGRSNYSGRFGGGRSASVNTTAGKYGGRGASAYGAPRYGACAGSKHVRFTDSTN